MTLADAKELLQAIVELLTSGLVSMGEGIGTGVSSFIQDLVWAAGTEGAGAPSAFILIVAVMGGISLAVSLGRRLFGFVFSLGGRR